MSQQQATPPGHKSALNRVYWGKAESIFLYGMAALVFAGIPAILTKWFPATPLMGAVIGLMVAAFYVVQGRQRGMVWADDTRPVPVPNLQQRRRVRLVVSPLLGVVELTLALGRNETAADFIMRLVAAVAFLIATFYYFRAAPEEAKPV